MIRRHLDLVVVVADDDIRRAQRLLWDRLRLVVEPGGCAAFAAVLSGRSIAEPNAPIVVVLSGANTTGVTFDA